MKGRITNIQRFSLHDGGGIRTTVFFHGCNMRCRWCHNPETLTERNAPLFYPAKCIGCGACLAACPTGARGNNFDGCIGCGKCAENCWPEALKMTYAEMTAEEVLREIRQDKTYYTRSAGGVTFSGGEALCQRAFLEELADACEREGIPMAIETNLLHDFDAIEPLLRRMSLVMADIKLLDEQEHRLWTGASNATVLENALRLGELGVPVIFRTPLIPGVTDTEANIGGIARFVSRIPNMQAYELLNFNPLGADKYSALRRGNDFADARPLPQERLRELESILQAAGVPYRIG